MTTAVEGARVSRPTTGAAVLDLAKALTGLALALFVCLHVVSLASVLVGPAVAAGLEEAYARLGLTAVGLPGIGLLLLVHGLLAAHNLPVRLDEQAALLSHLRRLPHASSRLWPVQVVTGLIVLPAAVIHIWTILTDLPATPAKAAARIHDGWWLALYLVLLTAAAVHLAAGCWRLGCKWGLVGRPGRPGLAKAGGWALAAILGLGLLSLLRYAVLSVG